MIHWFLHLARPTQIAIVGQVMGVALVGSFAVRDGNIVALAAIGVLFTLLYPVAWLTATLLWKWFLPPDQR